MERETSGESKGCSVTGCEPFSSPSPTGRKKKPHKKTLKQNKQTTYLEYYYVLDMNVYAHVCVFFCVVCVCVYV